MKLFSNACLHKEDIKIRSLMLKNNLSKVSLPAGSAVDFFKWVLLLRFLLLEVSNCGISYTMFHCCFHF